MPCPYFLPLQRLDAGPPARFPLIYPYRGECHASPAAHTPDESTLLALCNMGYARGRCKHFPAGDGPDAIRFAMGPGSVIRYARERNHFPYDAGDAPANPQGLFAAQLQAFRQSLHR